MCILGVSQSQAGLESLGYKFECSVSLNIFFLLISRKVRCSALSHFKVGSSFNILDFCLSLISSVTLLIYSSLFEITTPLPLSGSMIAKSLLHFNFCRILCYFELLKDGVYLYT